MAIGRVGTFAQQQALVSNALRTQSRMFELQQQVGTGLRAQTYSGIPENASRDITLRSQLSKAEQFIENISTVEKRLNLMNVSLDSIDNIAREFRSTLNNTLNGSGTPNADLSALASSFRDQVVDMLNISDDSRFLFSGSKIDTQPVDLNNGTYTAPAVPPFDAGPDTGYYEGDAVTQAARIDDNYSLQYGVQADSDPFEKVIRSLDNVAQLTFTNPPTAAELQVLRDAVTELTAAIQDNGANPTIADLANSVSLDLKVLSDVKRRHEDFINFATNSISEIETVDPAEAITLLNSQQIQLEASYAVIARLQGLTLNNFL